MQLDVSRVLGTRFCLLYQYKSTTTDAEAAAALDFTCFTGTKAQILTQKPLLETDAGLNLHTVEVNKNSSHIGVCVCVCVCVCA